MFGARRADGLRRKAEFDDAAHLGEPPAPALEAVGADVAIFAAMFVTDLISHPEFELFYSCAFHICATSIEQGVGHLRTYPLGEIKIFSERKFSEK